MVSVRRGKEGAISQKKQQNDSGEGEEKGKMPERFGESTCTNTKTDRQTDRQTDTLVFLKGDSRVQC